VVVVTSLVLLQAVMRLISFLHAAAEEEPLEEASSPSNERKDD
jgi:hypothetical protein